MLSSRSPSQIHGEGVLFSLPDLTFAIQTALTTDLLTSLLQPLALLVLYTPSPGTGDGFPEYSIQ